MRIEKINDNIIKVTISIRDLEERNIDLSTLNYNSPATQELFWDMMEQAEAEFGFTASDSQLVFEAAPDSEEGFVVTITKLDADGDFESIHKYIKSRLKSTDLKAKKKSRGKICSTISLYTFQCFDDLCSLARKIHGTFTGVSTLYKYRDAYYLLLTRNARSIASIKTLDAILGEFGSKVANTGFYEGYLNEYGEKLIEGNALEMLNDYF